MLRNERVQECFGCEGVPCRGIGARRMLRPSTPPSVATASLCNPVNTDIKPGALVSAKTVTDCEPAVNETLGEMIDTYRFTPPHFYSWLASGSTNPERHRTARVPFFLAPGLSSLEFNVHTQNELPRVCRTYREVPGHS